MFLKSLELEGFKSFVDSTKLSFNNGFTAIVGPNGCGKSNVSDAIRWVIGEQSSKSLRGTRITDLIFNGSGSRKPVNRTEISLTLTNVPPGLRIANVPNLSEEVKVTRCYHRSGESEFYINQVPCRLKDITDFLLDIGISPKVLTVIEQGHIQDIITAKPEERRVLIEEAAGILKFKHRRNEALRKLDASSQNLERISDIVQELGRRAESLKRQAAKAERYKAYQAEVKELSLKLFSRKIRRFSAELKESDEAYQTHRELKEEWSARAATLENQAASLEIEMQERAAKLAETRDRINELVAAIGKDEHNIELKASQVSQAEEDIKGAVAEVARMKAEIDHLAVEAEAEGARLTQVSEDINVEEQRLRGLVEGWDKEKENARGLEEQVHGGEQQILSLYQKVAQKKNELTAIDTRCQNLKERQEKVNHEIGELKNQADAGRQSLEEMFQAEESATRQLETLRQEAEALREKAALSRQALQALRDEHGALKEKHITRASLLSSLKELRSKFEGLQDGVKSLMSGSANGGRPAGLREVLVDVLKAPAEYEAALAAVLGEKLQSVIVDDYTDGLAAIEYLKSHQSGRGSFIPLRLSRAARAPALMNGDPGVCGRILEFIDCKQEYLPVIEALLDSVVLVKDLPAALKLKEDPGFQGTLVTLDGEMIDTQGWVTGGTASNGASSLLSRNRQIENLTGEVEQAKAKMENAALAIEAEQAAEAVLGGEIQCAENVLKEREIARAHGRKDLEQLQKDVHRLEEKTSALEYESASAGHELVELANRAAGLRHAMGAEEEEKERLEEQLEEDRARLVTLRNEMETKAADISAVKVLIASLKGRRENTLTEIKRIDLQKENLLQRIQKREEDQKDNCERIEALGEETRDLEKGILQRVREKDTLAERRVADEEALREKEAALKEMERETKELSRQIQDITERITKIEVERSETKIQIAHLEERAFDDFNVGREEILRQDVEEIDEKAVDEQVRELRGKVARMGEVNLAALSDFEEVNKRYTFLKKQQEDLTESIVMLHETIERIDRTTQQRFIQTFDQVNANFQEIFARLFQGGKARLNLTDNENPLEAGVEITANPAGKAMQNLTLLSGGEKSMTAIALMFAVFKVRPSPFCLLDEVDAPLDEANVIRFQEMLKEMAVNTQFILITHNQKTMSFADVLYGITMEEKGVSKAVSVHMN
jgi:chromosome segregation protein